MIFTEKKILGLDIGSNSIKIVEVSHTNKRKELSSFALAEHQIDLDGYWDNKKIEELSQLISNARKKAGFSSIKTVVALQAKYVFVTSMDFELGWNKKMIQEEINRQAKFFLPYPPDEMRVNWNVIQTNTNVSSLTGKQRVVINALPNFVIENITNLLNKSGLEGVALENQTISLTRIFLKSDRRSTIIVDLGNESTTYSIIIDGVLRNSFTSTIGFVRLDEALQNSLGIKLTHAENFKKDLSLVNLFELPKELSNHLSLINSELKNFYDQNVKIAQIPEQIILTGGGVLTAGILESLVGLPIPIKIGEISKDLYIDDHKIRSVSPIINSLSSSIGLAMREDI
ncbi:MAG: pilus assembly protein PilM [Patescibacteria group bacterium]